MPEKTAIAIFAATAAERDYLAAILGHAGFAAGGEDSVFSLKKDGKKLLLTGADTTKTLSLPVRASDLVEILQKTVRNALSGPAQVKIGINILDRDENLWLRPGESPLRLTEKETAILSHLAAAGGKPVGRQALLDHVWAYAEGVETHTLETHIYRLRQKLQGEGAGAPPIIKTEEDGYSLAL